MYNARKNPLNMRYYKDFVLLFEREQSQLCPLDSSHHTTKCNHLLALAPDLAYFYNSGIDLLI